MIAAEVSEKREKDCPTSERPVSLVHFTQERLDAKSTGCFLKGKPMSAVRSHLIIAFDFDSFAHCVGPAILDLDHHDWFDCVPI